MNALWRHVLAARLAYALWRGQRHLTLTEAWKMTARDANQRLHR